MKSLRYIIAIVLTLIATVECREDNPDVNLPDNTELTFSSHADLYAVSVEQYDTWEVKSCPKWASPMQETGTKGENISLFVEDNFSEEERKGEMVVLTDKHEIVYSLTQRSALTEDINAEIVSDNILYLTYGVGFGVNVLGTPSGDKYDYAGAIVNPANLTKVLETVGEPDAWCAEDHYYSHTESISGTSTTSLSTQLSVNAGIEVEISAFTGSVSGKFTNTESTNTETAYAMREIKHIVGSRYLRPGILRSLSAANQNSIFAEGFSEIAQIISENPDEKEAIDYLLEAYGTHLIVHGTLGGELELSMEMTSTEKISEMDINAALNMSCEVVNGDAAFNMTDSEKELMKNTKISLKTYGGNNVYTLKPGTTFEEAMQKALDAEKLASWVSSIQDKTSLALVEVQLYPIYDLMPNETARNAVREYMINEYQEKKTNNKPLLFAVNGFGDNGVITGEAYIPELDVKLECYQEMVPEISEDEPVIIIYSGTEDEMNYDRGFFIGSKTMKPGKLRRDREGKYSFESFDKLSAGQVTELYVNATGDITIAGKPGVAYSEVKFTGVTQEDLGKNRISESEDIKNHTYYATDLFNSKYWHGFTYDNSEHQQQTIAAASQGLEDTDIQKFISAGCAKLGFSCETHSGLYSYRYILYEGQNEYFRAYENVEGRLDVSFEVSIKPGTTIAVVSLTMDPDFNLSEGWKWIEKPYLHLKVNYDNTPRWRE